MNPLNEVHGNLRQAYLSHQEAVVELASVVQLLEGAKPVSRDEAERALSIAIDAGFRVREILAQACSLLNDAEIVNLHIAEADIPSELLRTTVEETLFRLDNLARAVPLRRLNTLLTELRRGHIVRVLRRERAETRQTDAIKEIEEWIERGVRSFPGPDDGSSWLKWFWSLENAAFTKVADDLGSDWPRLTDFLETVRSENWEAGDHTRTDLGDSPQVAESGGQAQTVERGKSNLPLDVAAPATNQGGVTVGPSVDCVVEVRTPPVPRADTDSRPAQDRFTRLGLGQGSTAVRKPGAAFRLPPVTSDSRAQEVHLPRSTVLVVASQMQSVREDFDSPDSIETAAMDAPSGPSEGVRLNEEPTVPSTSPLEPTAGIRAGDPSGVEVQSRAVGEEPPTPPTAMAFEAFAERYWTDHEDHIVEAPWCSPEFQEALLKAQLAALGDLDWRLVLSFACASESMSGPELAPRWLVEWALDYAHGRPLENDSHKETAWNRVRESVAEVRSIGDSPYDALAACLCLLSSEFVRTSSDAFLADTVDLLDLTGGMKHFVEDWLAVDRESDAEDTLRAQLDAEGNEFACKQIDIGSMEEALRTMLMKMTSAAGGAIKQTFCRQAWDKFMMEALPILQSVANGATDESTRRRLGDLPRIAERLFNKDGAKFQDRRRMDKAVTQLVEQGESLLRARSLSAERRDRRAGAAQFKEVSIDALRTLPTEDPVVGRIFLSLVAARVGIVRPPPRDLGFQNEHVAVRPLLVEAWDSYDLADIQLSPVAAKDFRLAAARLLMQPLPEPVDDLPRWLASRRPDLVASGEDLSPETVRRVQATQRGIDDDLSKTRGELRAIVQDLAELADTQLSLAQRALDVAEQVSDGAATCIQRHWLKDVSRTLQQRVRELEDHLRVEAIREGVPRDEVDAMLSSRQRAALIRRIRGHITGARPHRIRATLYRPDAATRWQVPGQVLQRQSKEVATSPAAKTFLDIWHRLRMPLRAGPVSDEDNSQLRHAFVEFFFEARKKNRVSKIQNRTPRGATHFSMTEMSDVRQWLEEVAPNPNFLPQLSRFQQMTIKLTPVETGGRTFGRRVAQEGSEGDLTVILCPGVDADQLRAAKEQLADRTRWSAVAVIDDLDVCRIFNPGDEAPEPLLALLEIVAEQQPWGRFCPYEVVEGQHIKLEMFVGRAKEAEQLAYQATYGRIFSGRRLGKTALLRFVGGKESLRSLPSRNRLHVVFCSIAGMESESAVVSAIENSVNEHFKLTTKNADSQATPIERISHIFKQILDASPNVSILCLLDEADTFYSEQTSSIASERQDSLSWWMSRHAEEARDAAQLPRLRFVFCGYLCTDQNRGVWENKGDVLFLKPLDPDDAVLLAAGPLARIGINAGGQADDIAFRCGYQPAVITRFGKELINHLERIRPRQSRDAAAVEARDVIGVFQTNEVQQAIREACWLNFVGHPLGQLVFSGLLMVLRNRSPGAAVADAPMLVKQAALSVDPNFDPSRIAVGSWEDVVFQLLRELVDRSLLVQSDYAPAAFRLRFPHHLPVLLQEDPARYLHDAIARIRSGASKRGQSWGLPLALLHSISCALGPEGEAIGLKAVVVATQWPEMVLHDDGGLLESLEIPKTKLVARVRVGQGAELAAAGLESAEAPLLVVGGVCVARAAAIRERTPGDVELARTERFTESQVTAWIQRKRAAEFTIQAIDPMKEIMRRTGGIPILVAVVDRWLIEEVEIAPNLGKPEVERLLTSIDEAVREVRRQLLPGGGAEALTEREVELIQLMAAAYDEYGDEFSEALKEGVVAVRGRPDIQAICMEDGPKLRMLMALGLLPRRPLGIGAALDEVGPVLRDDPIRNLLGLHG